MSRDSHAHLERVELDHTKNITGIQEQQKEFMESAGATMRQFQEQADAFKQSALEQAEGWNTLKERLALSKRS